MVSNFHCYSFTYEGSLRADDVAERGVTRTQCSSTHVRKWLHIGHNNKEMPPQSFLFVQKTWFVLIKIQAYEMKTILYHAVTAPEAEKIWNIMF
jgi:hypothetical protein